MSEPEPSLPHAGGEPPETAFGAWRRRARSTAVAAVRHSLLRWGLIQPPRPLPPPELAYAFLAQRLAHDLPARESGSVIACSRACAPLAAGDTALLLADALAKDSRRGITIVDADFVAAAAGSGLSARFGASGAGLGELLAGAATRPDELRIETAVKGVSLLPLGALDAVPPALAREELNAVLQALRQSAGHVLLVLSPLAEDARMVPVAAAADIALIVAEEAVTRLPEIEAAEAILAAAGIDEPKLVLATRRPAPGVAWPEPA